MAAFGLPVTPATVVLVMAAQGGGRILPLAPASAGLRLAMLSYGFVEVTGRPVDIAAITAFTFGVGAVMAVSGLAVATVILAQEFGTLSPRRAIAAARAGPRASRRAALASPSRPALLDEHGRPDRDALEQVDHVGHVHADAAVRRAPCRSSSPRRCRGCRRRWRCPSSAP